MASLQKSLYKILGWEGGYVNNPHDSGGATFRGVTLNTYKVYCKKKGLPIPTIEDLKKLDEVTIMDLARILFWDKIKGDFIKNQSMADLLFDFVWGSGLDYIKKIQKTLGVRADGIFGNISLNVLNQKTSKSLFDQLWIQRANYLKQCKGAPYYLKGWMRRLNSFTYQP